MDSLAARLRRLRLKRHLSIAKVARELQVSESTYRDWEYGRSIRGEPYMKLAALFGVSLSELMVGEAAPRAEIRADLDKIEEIIHRIKTQL